VETDGNGLGTELYWGFNEGSSGVVTEGVRTQLEVRNQRGRKTNCRGGGGVRGGRRGKEVEEEAEEVEDEEEEEVEEVKEVKEVKEVEEEVEEEKEEVERVEVVEEVEEVEEVEKVEAEVVLEKANFLCDTGITDFPVCH
jgi:outer membrane biosynthesis protein TonB